MTDSAASGTALMTGVKTNQMLIGLNSKGKHADCTSQKGNEINSILHNAHQGKYQILLKHIQVSYTNTILISQKWNEKGVHFVLFRLNLQIPYLFMC